MGHTAAFSTHSERTMRNSDIAMTEIVDIHAREILDSRGNPTV